MSQVTKVWFFYPSTINTMIVLCGDLYLGFVDSNDSIVLFSVPVIVLGKERFKLSHQRKYMEVPWCQGWKELLCNTAKKYTSIRYCHLNCWWVYTALLNTKCFFFIPFPFHNERHFLRLKEWVNLCGMLSYLILTVLCENRGDLFSYFTNTLIATLAKTTELQFVKKNWM